MIEVLKYYRRRLRKFRRKINHIANTKRIIDNFKNYSQDLPILLNGFPKSGNTWTRFLFFNYFNILSNNASRTLTYDELNELSPHVLGISYDLDFEPGFPPFYRTHQADSYMQPAFDYFRIVFLYRDPLDCLISYYHWLKQRAIPFAYYPPSERPKLANIDYFVKRHVHDWISHYKILVDKSIHILTYEAMRRDTYGEIHTLFTTLAIPINNEALKLAVDLSSAENIRAMGRETGQRVGGTIVKKGFVKEYEFVRSAKVGQFRSILQPETVAYVDEHLTENKIIIERYGK